MIPNHGPSMDFGLGETADAIRDTTARFAADRIAPIAADIDRENTFPRSLWPEMGALGLHGVTVEGRSAASASAISSTSWRWRRCLAPLRRSGCPTAPTPTSASISCAD